MAILLCNKCSYLREVTDDYIGREINCPVCKDAVEIHNAVALLKNIIASYQNLKTKYKQLKKGSADQQNIESLDDDIDLHNTAAMSDQNQYKPIIEWFDKKGIMLDIDASKIDTQGFYDEIAVALGENYTLLKKVNEQIKRAQRKNYNTVTLQIANHSPQEIQALTTYCRELYNFSFVAKYYYNKTDKRIHLTLQQAPAVINFFNGEWFEWFVFMKLLVLFYEKKIAFSALRSFKVHFPNEDKHEVDVFFLINNELPIFIECKSGEFRSTIDKYNRLRKRMAIDKQQFVMLILGLSDEQTKGLTSMYDITFLNENNFVDYFLTVL